MKDRSDIVGRHRPAGGSTERLNLPSEVNAKYRNLPSSIWSVRRQSPKDNTAARDPLIEDEIPALRTAFQTGRKPERNALRLYHRHERTPPARIAITPVLEGGNSDADAHQ